jgi:hypothetical protein
MLSAGWTSRIHRSEAGFKGSAGFHFIGVLMNDVYVHTLRYHYSGRGSRQSRIMFPISYGPFKDEETAWEWIRQRGITRATRLMERPAAENIGVLPIQLIGSSEQGGSSRAQANPGP